MRVWHIKLQSKHRGGSLFESSNNRFIVPDNWTLTLPNRPFDVFFPRDLELRDSLECCLADVLLDLMLLVERQEIVRFPLGQDNMACRRVDLLIAVTSQVN